MDGTVYTFLLYTPPQVHIVVIESGREGENGIRPSVQQRGRRKNVGGRSLSYIECEPQTSTLLQNFRIWHAGTQCGGEGGGRMLSFKRTGMM